MKKLLFKFFAWRIEIKLSKIPNTNGNERCLYLANKLYTELQKHNYEMKSTDDIGGCDVRLFTNNREIEHRFRISNILAGWEIKGDRT